MEYSSDRVQELVKEIPWHGNAKIRIFWLRHTNGSRDELASQLRVDIDESEAIVPMVLRSVGFKNGNSVLSDVQALFEANKPILEQLRTNRYERLTVLILSKEDFRLVNASSPITLPDWFPICPALDTFFSISDLGQAAEIKPLNCVESRSDHIAKMIFELEDSIVKKLKEIYKTDSNRAKNFLSSIQQTSTSDEDIKQAIEHFSAHIDSIEDPRAYRPNAAEKSKFLAARILKLVLNHSPKQLSSAANEIGKSFLNPSEIELKPTFFAVMWRPANKVSITTTNWHSILIAFFQAYQLMNANAHAGEFPSYSVALQYSTSLNLRNFLDDAKEYVETLT